MTYQKIGLNNEIPVFAGNRRFNVVNNKKDLKRLMKL